MSLLSSFITINSILSSSSGTMPDSFAPSTSPLVRASITTTTTTTTTTSMSSNVTSESGHSDAGSRSETTPETSPTKEKPDYTLLVAGRRRAQTPIVVRRPRSESTPKRECTPTFRSWRDSNVANNDVTNFIATTPASIEVDGDDLGYDAECESEEEEGEEGCYYTPELTTTTATTRQDRRMRDTIHRWAVEVEVEAEFGIEVVAPVPAPSHRLNQTLSPFERPGRPNPFEDAVRSTFVGYEGLGLGLGLGLPQDVSPAAPRLPSYSKFEGSGIIAPVEQVSSELEEEESNGQLELSTINDGLELITGPEESPMMAKVVARKPALRPLILEDEISPMSQLPSPQVSKQSPVAIGLGIFGVDDFEKKDEETNVQTRELVGLGLDLDLSVTQDHKPLVCPKTFLIDVSRLPEFCRPANRLPHSTSSLSISNLDLPMTDSTSERNEDLPTKSVIGLGLSLPSDFLAEQDWNRSTVEHRAEPIVPPSLQTKRSNLPTPSPRFNANIGSSNQPPSCRIPFQTRFGGPSMDLNLDLTSAMAALAASPIMAFFTPRSSPTVTSTATATTSNITSSSRIANLLARIERERVYSPSLFSPSFFTWSL